MKNTSLKNQTRSNHQTSPGQSPGQSAGDRARALANAAGASKAFKSLRRVWALTRKEMRVLTHDKLAMFLLIIFPISMILLATFGGATGTAESDRTAMSTERYSTPKIGLADFDHSEGYGGADLSEEFCAIFEEYERQGECVLFRGYSRNQMEKMLAKIAEFYEDQVDAAVAGLTSIIEPLIIGFLGIVVGFIVIALFMPILMITQIV